MLINLSNHPISQWPKEQIELAKLLYGELVDMQFPNVDPQGDEEYIKELAEECANKILKEDTNKTTVHIMGEMTLSFCLINILKEKGIECIASTTKRIVEELPNNAKNVIFKFERFRRY